MMVLYHFDRGWVQERVARVGPKLTRKLTFLATVWSGIGRSEGNTKLGGMGFGRSARP